MGSKLTADRWFLFFPDLNDGAEGHVPVRNHSSDCYSHRPESGRLQESACQPRGSCHEGSQIRGQVHRPGPCHVEGENEARDEGRQAGDVRQSRGGEGKASQEGRQGLACGSAEEEHLSQHLRHICTWTFHAALCLAQIFGREVCTCHSPTLMSRKK